MSRQYIDCREFPSAMNYSVALSAHSDKELLEVAVNGHADTPELHKQLAVMFKLGTPPLTVAQASIASA